MNTKIVSAAFACVCCVVGSANATSIVVSDVSVSVGTGVYNAAFVGWQLPVTLTTGQTLVLAQGHAGPNATSSYNFDLSDFGAGAPAVVSWTINGVSHTLTDIGYILTAHETAATCCYNEAHGFVEVYEDDLYSILFGYADNVHGGETGCGTYWAGIEGVNTAPLCAPFPFTSADIFMGAPALLQPAANPFHCAFGEPCAWDTAVIAIVPAATRRTVDPVPEPAGLLLLGGGLLGLAWRTRKRH